MILYSIKDICDLYSINGFVYNYNKTDSGLLIMY